MLAHPAKIVPFTFGGKLRKYGPIVLSHWQNCYTSQKCYISSKIQYHSIPSPPHCQMSKACCYSTTVVKISLFISYIYFSSCYTVLALHTAEKQMEYRHFLIWLILVIEWWYLDCLMDNSQDDSVGFGKIWQIYRSQFSRERYSLSSYIPAYWSFFHP